MSDLSRHLTEFRKKNQYTQEALAQEIGVSEKTISSWETGRTQPDVESLKTLSALYGISIDELVYGSRAKRYQSFSDMITENEALLFRIAKTLLLYDNLSETALRTAITRALKSLPDTSNVGELLPWFLKHLLYSCKKIKKSKHETENDIRPTDAFAFISGLPESDAIIVELFLVEKMSPARISELLSLPEAATNNVIKRYGYNGKENDHA